MNWGIKEKDEEILYFSVTKLEVAISILRSSYAGQGFPGTKDVGFLETCKFQMWIRNSVFVGSNHDVHF